MLLLSLFGQNFHKKIEYQKVTDSIQFSRVIFLRLTSFTTKQQFQTATPEVLNVSLTRGHKVNSILRPKGENNCLVILRFKNMTFIIMKLCSSYFLGMRIWSG